MPEGLAKGLAIALGVAAIANGVFMTFAPESWYWAVPGVPDRGPFNQHFVRDIGILYALIGGAFVVGAVRRAQRVLCWGLPTAWLGGHALFHVWEVAVGICGPEALVVDFGGVTLPALLGALLVWRAATERAHG